MAENWKELVQEAKQNIWQPAAQPTTLIDKLAHGSRLTSSEEKFLYKMMVENAQRLFGVAAMSETKPPDPVLANVEDGNFKLEFLEKGICIVVDTQRSISIKLVYKRVNWKPVLLPDPNDPGSRGVLERITAKELPPDYLMKAIALVEKYSQRK